MQHTKRKSFFTRFLDALEILLNHLPSPVTCYFLLTVGFIFLSDYLFKSNVSASYMDVDKTTLNAVEVVISSKSLLSSEGLLWIISNLVTNFLSFRPVATFTTAILVFAVLEFSGLLNVLLKLLTKHIPAPVTTMILIFLSVISNVVYDFGYVILIPLAAYIFRAYGRHPLAGVVATFASTATGYAANIFVTPTIEVINDLTLNITNLYELNYVLNESFNYYFFALMTLALTVIGTIVTESLIVKRLGNYDDIPYIENHKLTRDDRNGLYVISIITLVILFFFLISIIPDSTLQGGGVFLGEINDNYTYLQQLLHSPFISNFVTIIGLWLILIGVVFGYLTRNFDHESNVITSMSEEIKSASYFYVTAFFASQLLAMFTYTNIGIVTAVRSAQYVSSSDIRGMSLVFTFILIVALINIFIPSITTKWSIMSLVFIPTLMTIGFDPEFTELLFRIGDSITNSVTPFMGYTIVFIAYAQIYPVKKKATTRVGSLFTLILPYQLFYLIAFIIGIIIYAYI